MTKVSNTPRNFHKSVLCITILLCFMQVCQELIGAFYNEDVISWCNMSNLSKDKNAVMIKIQIQILYDNSKVNGNKIHTN